MKVLDLKRILEDETAQVLILVPGTGNSDGFWVMAKDAESAVVEEVAPGRFQVDTSDKEWWELSNPKIALLIC